MRYLGPDDLRAALPVPAAIDAMRDAFGTDRETPQRTLIGPSLFMPGRVGRTIGIKVVSVRPGAPSGIVVTFDEQGAPTGICDGATLTAIRTGAACGLATDLLAPTGSSTLAMLGAGAMAPDLIEAVRAVRRIDTVRIWSRHYERAVLLADQVGGEATADVDEALEGADIVSTATPATAPLFLPGSVRQGAHVNAIGAFKPTMVELPADLLRSAFVVVDDRDAAGAEAGDLIQAGVRPNATMADLIGARAAAPGGATTVFKSVGIAAQDVAAAAAALRAAGEMGIGLEL